MASNGSPRMVVSAGRLATILFAVFVLMSFVDMTPLTSRSVADVDSLSESSIARQIAFVATGLIVFLIAWARRNSTVGQAISPWVVASLAWCLATLAWASVPDVGGRRLALTVIVTLSVLSSVTIMGPLRALRIFATLLALMVVASLLAGVFFASGRHQLGDPEPGLVGAWRGIFFHKNQAGFAAAMCVVASWFMYRLSGTKAWFFTLLSGGGLLVLSASKTSLGILVPAALIGFFFEWAHRNRRFKAALLGLVCTVFVVVAVSFASFAGTVEQFLGNPEALTGRGAVWAALTQMISDRPLVGFGYGSIFGVGPNSEWFNYASGWAVLVAHGHNGYLDVLTATGVIGLSLVLIAFVVEPIRSMVRIPRENSVWVGCLSTTLVFVLLHNAMESSLLDRARPEWVTLILVCAVARCLVSRFANR